MIVLARAVDGGAVVARAGEEMMLANIRGSKDVKAIAPSIPAHNLTVAYFYRFAATDGDLRRQWTVDEHVLRIAYHDALMMSGHDDAVAEDTYVVSLIDGEPAFDDGSLVEKYRFPRRHGNGVAMEVVNAGTKIDKVSLLCLGFVHEGVGKDVEVVVDVAVDLDGEVARPVNEDLEGVALLLDRDAVRERANLITIYMLCLTDDAQFDGSAELELRPRHFSDVVACSFHLIDLHQVSVEGFPLSAGDAGSYLEVVLQIGALRSGGCAELGGRGGETEKERDECKECFHGDAIGRHFPKGKRTELLRGIVCRCIGLHCWDESYSSATRRQEMKGDGLAASDGKLLCADVRTRLE